MSEETLRADRVSKQIGHRRILHEVNLVVGRGERVALLGPNGAGKSTLLRICATLLKPTSGQVFIGGEPAAEKPALRARLGVLVEHTLFYMSLSGRENLLLYARLYGVPDARRWVDGLLDRMGLALFAGEPVRTYSRGMRQRLAIARTLVHSPDLLLLDEPYTALDQEGSARLNEVLTGLGPEGRSLLLVTHELEPGGAPLPVDRAVLLEGGRLVDEVTAGSLDGDPAQVGRWYRERVRPGLGRG
ncbi:ABC transporter ATP-binding protein [Limnochorda pilosa]|uniref:Sodium ABC transporter ATP-binding protein n=1 Tax=Limnochorda pilosa TaxID=1555112 RepID=A0A0K2SJG3_LIMPI|nr:ABC transporter ATP-binding protein [Limnochorda pilosa]BAS27256.1 sodium ABC transporter ATP-binding protein [Limnochorda pilosa]